MRPKTIRVVNLDFFRHYILIGEKEKHKEWWKMQPKTMDDIPKMTLSQLEDYLISASHDSQGRRLAMEEYNRKKLDLISKPHWSVIPSFLLLVISVFISLLALFLSIKQQLA
ncbi:hypothetical protein D6A01_24365 [Vibrio parahaemolyticus]|nr:hypothetical protein [Vibrio parahaemolyticus]OQU28515.1 hypothetical protein EN05_019885 [Vibrio parahaemolyticus]